MLRAVQAVPGLSLQQGLQQVQHHRAAAFSPTPPSKDSVDGTGVPATPGRTVSGPLPFPASPHGPAHGVREAAAGEAQVPATPGRSPSGAIVPGSLRAPQSLRQERGASPDQVRPHPPSSRGERGPSPDAQQTSMLRSSGGAHSAAGLLAPSAVAIAASTPVLRGRGALTSTADTTKPRSETPGSAQAPPTSGSSNPTVSKSSLLAGSSLGHLITKVMTSVQEREQEMRRQHAEQRELEELLARSKEELQQLVSVVSQLTELQQSATDANGPSVLPDILHLGPERPRPRARPPFFWQPSQDYAEEFEVSGECGEIVMKTKDFEDQGWVIPVGGSWRLSRGGVYRWTVRIERKCPSRPQLQLGIHGMNHSQPWRLVTTSRCSWSRDDEPWQDRPGGDRLIDEGDFVHVEVDLRGVQSKCGTFALAINDEPFEQFFDDIPLSTPYPLIPVISMGGDQSRVRLCPSY